MALDEPTSQLDPAGAAAVLAACRGLAAEGRAVVVAEHRLETLGPAADRTLIVEGGRVTAAIGGRAAGPRATCDRPPRAGEAAGRGDAAWELRGVAADPAGPRASREAVLHDLSLAGGRGEVVALVGPERLRQDDAAADAGGAAPPAGGHGAAARRAGRRTCRRTPAPCSTCPRSVRKWP